MKQVQEYKRKCKECGKVWHSLVGREKEIKGNINSNSCAACGTGCGDMGALAQQKRNIEASTDLLDKLKKCPECGSQNYEETIISYEKKI